MFFPVSSVGKKKKKNLPCKLPNINQTYFSIYTLLDFGEGNGTPLQYSCLENPMDGGV